MGSVGRQLALTVLALALGLALIVAPYLISVPRSTSTTTSRPTIFTTPVATPTATIGGATATTQTFIPTPPTASTVRTPTSTLSPLPVIPAPTPTPSSPYTRTYAERSCAYLFRLGDWAIVIEITSDGRGVLVLRYVGDKLLEVENPLLPPIAGLNIALSYNDPSRDTVIRKSGTYYNNKVVLRPSNESSISFDAKGLRLIRVEGAILGKIPVRISLPLESRALGICTRVVTVTVTKIATIYTETQTATAAGYCEFVKEAEYPEPVRESLSRVELDNETVVSDGVLEIRIPLTAMGTGIPLIFENKQSTPLLVPAYYVEYTILNATEDGVHYRQVNHRMVYAVPMPTMPPLSLACRDKQPPGTTLINYGFYVLEPGERSTLLKLTIPKNIDELQGFREGWVYIKAKIRYIPIKEVYRIDAATEDYLSYLNYYRAVTFYSTGEIEVVFRTYIKLFSE